MQVAYVTFGAAVVAWVLFTYNIAKLSLLINEMWGRLNTTAL